MADDELALPFIFIADGADPPPELAAFKSAHLDWVSFPATFIPHEEPVQQGEGFPTHQPTSKQAWEPPRRKKPSPPQPTRTDLSAAFRAFQRANAERLDPVTALRALRDTPAACEDQSARYAGSGWGNANPGRQLISTEEGNYDSQTNHALAPAVQNSGKQPVAPTRGEFQRAQELLLEEPPAIIRPPLESFPNDPTQPPGPGYEWRGQPGSTPGGPRGSWYNPQTRETLRPDLSHPEPSGPHYDYRAPNGDWYRWFPNGNVIPKA